MSATVRARRAGRVAAATATAVIGAYAAYVGATWYRFGPAPHGVPKEPDTLLDRFMPSYDVLESHHVRVAAPAAITLAAAKDLALFNLPAVRAIVRARELLLRAPHDERVLQGGLLAAAQAIGWGVLGETPGQEIVCGAVTKPWEASPTFRALPPAEFRAFAEPGYVKIAWTLRADATGSGTSVFVTETRAIATDARSRRRFRQYWSLLSPGIILIRWVALPAVKADAERRGTDAIQPTQPAESTEATQLR
jgi:hypothetical protein